MVQYAPNMHKLCSLSRSTGRTAQVATTDFYVSLSHVDYYFTIANFQVLRPLLCW